MSVHSYSVGSVVLTRVGYVDIEVTPETVGLTGEEVLAHPWADPVWANGSQPRVAAAVWIIADGDARIAVDPAISADSILRSEADASTHQDAFAALLADAGYARETITHSIASHFEGVGMHAWRNDDGAWSPFFPNGAVIVHQAHLDALDSGAVETDNANVLEQLRDQGVVEAIREDRYALSEHVTIERTNAHSPGHVAVHIESDGASAILVGHLAVSPLHFVTGENAIEHPDPAAAERFLESYRQSGALLAGPLWPAPGAGHWTNGRIVPALPNR